MSETTRLEFGVSQNMLTHIFHNQSRSKLDAIKELIQNSSDAGATEIHVTFDEKRFSVSDNGTGFRSEDDIRNGFQNFGTERDVSDVAFGRYRMGRGMIMGLGKTEWTSGPYKMLVDINSNGHTFDLEVDHSAKVGGCHISGEWYEECDGLDQFNWLWSELRSKMTYLFHVKVMINGKPIGIEASEIDWTLETDDYYFLHDSDQYALADVEVYNLGVYVGRKRINHLSGLLISKRHMSLNMTRSDIKDSCPVLARFSQDSKQLLPEFTGKNRLTRSECNGVVERFLDGMADYSNVSNIRAFTTITGSRVSLRDLSQKPFSVAASRDPLVNDRAAQVCCGAMLDPSCLPKSGEWMTAKCFYEEHDSVVELTGVNFDLYRNNIAVLALLRRIYALALDANSAPPSTEGRRTLSQLCSILRNFRCFAQLDDEANLDDILIPISKATSQEVMAIRAIKYASAKYAKLAKSKRLVVRDFHVGESLQAAGWTNMSYIAIERRYLQRLDLGYNGAERIVDVVLHEYAHIVSQSGEHNFDFYKCYHDLSDRIPKHGFASEILRQYDTQISKRKTKPTTALVNAMKIARRNGQSLALKEFNKKT